MKTVLAYLFAATVSLSAHADTIAPPSWVLDTPDGYVSSSSAAPTLAYALDKAILNGQRAIAEQMSGRLSSIMTDSIEERSDGSMLRSSSRLIISRADVVVRCGAVEKKAVHWSDGGRYIAYVLMKNMCRN